MTAKPALQAVPSARKRAPRKPKPKPVDLVSAVDAALEEMHWLSPSDGALAEVARLYAATIEAAADDPEEGAKRAGWMGPHLVNALKALGGTPADRKALGVEREVKGRLALLKEARAKG